MSFTPGHAPSHEDVRAIVRWATTQFELIARQFNETEIVRLVVLNVAPDRPREGMVAYADGTNWNPGAGRGPYAYISGSWTKLFP